MGWRTGPPIPLGRWRSFRRQIFDARGWRCERCQKAGRLELHHVKPIYQGGKVFEETNCEILCRKCHITHHRKTPEYPEEKKQAWKNLIARFG